MPTTWIFVEPLSDSEYISASDHRIFKLKAFVIFSPATQSFISSSQAKEFRGRTESSEAWETSRILIKIRSLGITPSLIPTLSNLSAHHLKQATSDNALWYMRDALFSNANNDVDIRHWMSDGKKLTSTSNSSLLWCCFHLYVHVSSSSVIVN